jgi:hypothetical protein
MPRSSICRLSLLAIFLLAAVLSAGPQTRSYADPGGAFALQLPNDWTVRRVALGLDEGWITEMASPNAGPRIECLVVSDEEGLDPGSLEDESESMIEMAQSLIQANGAILSTAISKTRLAGRAAVRCDLTYSDAQEGLVRKGFMIVVLGRKNVILALVSAPQADTAGLGRAEGWLNTLAVESPTPAAASPSPQGLSRGASLFTPDTLKNAARKIKANLKRDAADTTLVPDSPPLTHGSVVNFVQVVSLVFGIEFNETEFELTRQRFIEYYQKADAAGKAQIALGGASLLAGLKQGSPAEQTKAKEEVRQVMAQRFAAGAQAGIEWAVALHEAIQRRSRTLATTRAEAPPGLKNQPSLDSRMSEADLNAALEMLYFMWVAAGRDPNMVTIQAVAEVQQYLASNFARFDPTVQYLLANAEKLYAGVRMTWQAADPSQRALLAQQYSQALNEMGFTVGSSGGGGGSAWDDVAGKDASTIKAELAMSYAGSAATSTSFSGRTITW